MGRTVHPIHDLRNQRCHVAIILLLAHVELHERSPPSSSLCRLVQRSVYRDVLSDRLELIPIDCNAGIQSAGGALSFGVNACSIPYMAECVNAAFRGRAAKLIL